jgi:hypothetical protein
MGIWRLLRTSAMFKRGAVFVTHKALVGSHSMTYEAIQGVKGLTDLQ